MTRPQSRPSVPYPRALRVLVVLSDAEIQVCFPDDLLGALRNLAGDFAHALPELDLSRDLDRVFERVRPDVLIAGRSTPPLPEKLPGSLRYVCCLGGSVKRLMRREHLESGPVVTCWTSPVDPASDRTPTQRRRDVGTFALRNLRAFIERRQLEAVVTPESYDEAP